MLLTEHASIYLGQAETPDGELTQNLDLAQLHIDLLGVLKEKTSGNLVAQEQAVLDDILARLRFDFAARRR